jgi:hypothetical protein
MPRSPTAATKKSRPVRRLFLQTVASGYFVCAMTHFANAFGRLPYLVRKSFGSDLRNAPQVFDAFDSDACSLVVAASSFFATQLPNALLRSVFVP